MNNLNGRRPSLPRGGGTSNTYDDVDVKQGDLEFARSRIGA